jgi:hypothetical protein
VHYKFRTTWPSSGASKIAVENCCIQSMNTIPSYALVYVPMHCCASVVHGGSAYVSCAADFVVDSFLYSRISGRMEVVLEYRPCPYVASWLRAQEVLNSTQLPTIDFASWDKRLCDPYWPQYFHNTIKCCESAVYNLLI